MKLGWETLKGVWLGGDAIKTWWHGLFVCFCIRSKYVRYWFQIKVFADPLRTNGGANLNINTPIEKIIREKTDSDKDNLINFYFVISVWAGREFFLPRSLRTSPFYVLMYRFFWVKSQQWRSVDNDKLVHFIHSPLLRRLFVGVWHCVCKAKATTTTSTAMQEPHILIRTNLF